MNENKIIFILCSSNNNNNNNNYNSKAISWWHLPGASFHQKNIAEHSGVHIALRSSFDRGHNVTT